MLCEVLRVESEVIVADVCVGSPHSTRERAGLLVTHVMVAVDATAEAASEEIVSGA
jgi:hypothetical protein